MEERGGRGRGGGERGEGEGQRREGVEGWRREGAEERRINSLGILKFPRNIPQIFRHCGSKYREL